MNPSSHTIEMHAVPPEKVEASLINPDMGMLILTWVVFLLLLAVLYKFAWKPILTALDEREQSIKKSIEDVERIKTEMDSINNTRQKMLLEAQEQSKEIIENSRKAAKEAAQTIERKAKDQAQISLENAVRDIKEESQKAQQALREESAKLAVGLAEKLLEEKLNSEKDKKVINRIIKDI